MQNTQKTESYLQQIVSIIKILWVSRKFIATLTLSITILSIIISLILPEYFKSTAIILPDMDKTKLGMFGGMSDLAAMAGINIGSEGAIIKLYPTIIQSESVLRNVVYKKYFSNRKADSINLIQYWEIEEKNPQREFEIVLKLLRENLDVSMEIKTLAITLNIETKEPQLSADILNNIINTLDSYIRTKRNTNASEQRKWIEARLSEVKADLKNSENALKEFREKNRVVASSPQLLLEQERLTREIQINSTIYIELKKQYELARIEEIRTTPIINVLDYARPAAKKSSPKRSIIVIFSFIFSLIGSSSYIILDKKYKEYFINYIKNLI